MQPKQYKLSTHYFLLDASAYCRFTDDMLKARPEHNILNKFIDGCFYYIPQFCIAEVFNTYARWHYAEKKISESRYKELCEIFKILIRNRRVLYPYDLQRYHNLNCDYIFKIEHTTPHLEQEAKLSSFDILIIAMGIELQRIHGNENTTILSCDKRIVKIAGKLNINTEFYQ
jgi:hypothetical protein